MPPLRQEPLHFLDSRERRMLASCQVITQCHERRSTETAGWKNRAKKGDRAVAIGKRPGSVRGWYEFSWPKAGENTDRVADQIGSSTKPRSPRLKRLHAVITEKGNPESQRLPPQHLGCTTSNCSVPINGTARRRAQCATHVQLCRQFPRRLPAAGRGPGPLRTFAVGWSKTAG
jgi:hypothetical protein